MSAPRVFVTRAIPENGLRLLSEHCQVHVHPGSLPPTRDELLRGIAGCRGILSLLSDRIDGEVMDAAGGELQVIANYAVGFNNVDLAAAAERHVAVGNTPDVLTDATADLAIALLLTISRRLHEAAMDVLEGRWQTWEPLGWLGADILGKTLGIVGMGRIGAAVARRLHGGWQLPVLYTARNDKPDLDRELGACRVELQELLSTCDIISVHVPLTPETRHLIGAPELALMKPNTILVNTARGEVIDQDALVESLSQGQILGTGLDVCTPEPLPTEHPLLQLENCLVVPHIGSATVHAREAMAHRAAQNILAGIQGQPLPFPVTMPPVAKTAPTIAGKPASAKQAGSKPGHGAVAIVVEQGRFLVIRRSASVRAPNMLCFAGGTIESGETPADAAVRELREELQLDGVAHGHIWQSRTAWGTLLEWILVERRPGAEPQANPDEVAEWMWLDGPSLLTHPDLLPSVPAFFSAWAEGQFTLPATAGEPRPEWKRFGVV